VRLIVDALAWLGAALVAIFFLLGFAGLGQP